MLASPLRVLAAAMVVVFAGFAAVQLNDDDAPVWIALYAASALISLAAAARGWASAPLCALVAAGYLAGALRQMPPWALPWMDLEEGRETMGLFICAGWNALLALGAACAPSRAPGKPKRS
jgi:hypothetical protein